MPTRYTIQAGVASSPGQANELIKVTFPEAFNRAPSVSLTLQSGSFTGKFGNPPFLVSVDAAEMVINPNNYGCLIDWIAVGD